MALKDHLSHYQPVPTPGYDADVTLFVSADGRCSSSDDDVYTTLEQALEALRTLRLEHPESSVTIRVAPGEYLTAGVKITADMSGSENAPVTIVAEKTADGRAILNGGVILKPEDFTPIPQEIRDRLHGDAKDCVVCADLTKYGLTADDWGPIYTVGGFNTAGKYDDADIGIGSELFFNNCRMTLARWPNKGQYARLDDVADVGDCREFPPQNYYLDWDNRRNHRGGTYIISRSDNARVSAWSSYEDIWAFGYFMWDWADSSTPVTFDTEHRRFFPRYVSQYAARRGAEFYFYNVLDELDEPGEYYLDRKTGKLYIYPTGDITTARIEMSIATAPAITIDGANYVTVDGFDICNIRDDAIIVKGNHVTVRDCTVTNAANYAINAVGSYITIDSCDISHTGRGGIILTGGDRKSLTPGHCSAVNNYIHDFAEIYQTYAGGIHLNGVGNLAAHNEITNTPHAAIFYSGNDHLLEYNYIHDVVLHSNDAGAIYSGQDWSQQGTVIRYNVLENIGGDEFHPQGIYWDDGLSGQTAYGNLIIRAGQNGFQCGGGFSCNVTHNLIVDTPRPISYDSRNRDGLVESGWCHADVDTKEGRSWKLLYAMPFRSPLWIEHYPVFATLRDDLENHEAWDDPNFPTNPANCVVTGNIILRCEDCHNYISRPAQLYSRIENNPEFEIEVDPGFVNMADGDYRLRPDSEVRKEVPDFPDIPYDKIGRY